VLNCKPYFNFFWISLHFLQECCMTNIIQSSWWNWQLLYTSKSTVAFKKLKSQLLDLTSNKQRNKQTLSISSHQIPWKIHFNVLSIQDYVFKMVCSLLIIVTKILKVFLIPPIPTPLPSTAPPYQYFVKSTKYEDPHSITHLSYLHNIWCYICKLATKLIYGVYNLVAKEHTLTLITWQEFVVKQLSHVSSAEAKSWWPEIWRLSWDGIRAAT
jgi:hypothetical protein